MDMKIIEARSKSVSLLFKHNRFILFFCTGQNLLSFFFFLNLPICSQDEESDDERPPSYGAPLEAALAERDQKKGSNKPRVVFINPAFSTTDLQRTHWKEQLLDSQSDRPFSTVVMVLCDPMSWVINLLEGKKWEPKRVFFNTENRAVMPQCVDKMELTWQMDCFYMKNVYVCCQTKP